MQIVFLSDMQNLIRENHPEIQAEVDALVANEGKKKLVPFLNKKRKELWAQYKVQYNQLFNGTGGGASV